MTSNEIEQFYFAIANEQIDFIPFKKEEIGVVIDGKAQFANNNSTIHDDWLLKLVASDAIPRRRKEIAATIKFEFLISDNFNVDMKKGATPASKVLEWSGNASMIYLFFVKGQLYWLACSEIKEKVLHITFDKTSFTKVQDMTQTQKDIFVRLIADNNYSKSPSFKRIKVFGKEIDWVSKIQISIQKKDTNEDSDSEDDEDFLPDDETETLEKKKDLVPDKELPVIIKTVNSYPSHCNFPKIDQFKWEDKGKWLECSTFVLNGKNYFAKLFTNEIFEDVDNRNNCDIAFSQLSAPVYLNHTPFIHKPAGFIETNGLVWLNGILNNVPDDFKNVWAYDKTGSEFYKTTMQKGTDFQKTTLCLYEQKFSKETLTTLIEKLCNPKTSNLPQITYRISIVIFGILHSLYTFSKYNLRFGELRVRNIGIVEDPENKNKFEFRDILPFPFIIPCSFYPCIKDFQNSWIEGGTINLFSMKTCMEKDLEAYKEDGCLGSNPGYEVYYLAKMIVLSIKDGLSKNTPTVEASNFIANLFNFADMCLMDLKDTHKIYPIVVGDKVKYPEYGTELPNIEFKFNGNWINLFDSPIFDILLLKETKTTIPNILQSFNLEKIDDYDLNVSKFRAFSYLRETSPESLNAFFTAKEVNVLGNYEKKGDIIDYTAKYGLFLVPTKTSPMNSSPLMMTDVFRTNVFYLMVQYEIVQSTDISKPNLSWLDKRFQYLQGIFKKLVELSSEKKFIELEKRGVVPLLYSMFHFYQNELDFRNLKNLFIYGLNNKTY